MSYDLLSLVRLNLLMLLLCCSLAGNQARLVGLQVPKQTQNSKYLRCKIRETHLNFCIENINFSLINGEE